MPNRPRPLFLLLIALPGLCRADVVRSTGIMEGTPYATKLYERSSGAPGPTIVIIGGLHGNEPAGYLAARRIANWKCMSGRLVVLPEAHIEAIRRNVRAYPGNMNSMFPGKENGTSMERLAFEIWRKAVVAYKPDLLLTLHESLDFHVLDPSRYGQSLVYDFRELDPLMQRALDRVNPDIPTPLHRFVLFPIAFKGCPTYAAWKWLRVPATSIETSRTLDLNTRVAYQLMMCMGFLDEFGMDYAQQDVPYLSTRG